MYKEMALQFIFQVWKQNNEENLKNDRISAA